MSMRKRVRPKLEESASESESSDETTNSQTGTPRKRQRQSTDPTEVEETDDGAAEFDPKVVYGIDEGDVPTSDEGEEDGEEEDLVDLPNRRDIAPEDNKAADYGVLQKFYCQDFMCHHAFEVVFGPHINFVIGQNGSGKSAVLTGITLCLGGSARFTNRGQSIKDFIMHGKDRALLSVTIKNRGEGYRKDVYGDAIIVERTINREGGSNYKIKGKDGKVHSNKKEELDNICDYMCLQVDNPMNILTQDLAREFIGNSTEAKKYAFFMEGVQLEQLIKDYNLFQMQIDQLAAGIANSEADLGALEEAKNRAQERRKMAKGYDKLREEIVTKMSQMAWVQVEEQEHELEAKKAMVVEQEGRIQVCRDGLQKTQDEFEEVNKELEKALKEVERAREERGPVQEKVTEEKERLNAIRDELTSARAQHREYYDAKQKAEKEVHEAREALKKEEERVNGNSMVDSKKDQISENEKRIEQTRIDLENFEKEVEDAKRQIQGLRAEINQMRQPIEEKRAAVQECEKRVQDIRSDSISDVQRYGRGIDALLNDIDRERRWKKKPVGPMGKHIKLLREDWAFPLETIFGNALNAYIVTNMEDKVLLDRLLKKHNIQRSFIYILKEQAFRFNEPDPEHLTILRALNIDNDFVKRQLIIANYIEQAVLMEDMTEAMRFVRSPEAQRNVRFVYAKHPSERNYAMIVRANGTTPVQPWKGTLRMEVEKAAQLKSAEIRLEDARRELRDQMEMEKELREKLIPLEQILRTEDRRRTVMQSQIKTLNLKNDDLREQIDIASRGSQIEDFKSKLAVAENKLASYEGQGRDIERQIQTINARAEEAKACVDSAKRELEKKENAVEKFDRRYKKVHADKVQKLEDIRYWQLKIEQENRKLDELRIAADNQETTVADWVKQAEEAVGARVVIPPNENRQTLTNKLDQLEKRVKQAEKRLGATTQQIADECLKAAQAYDNARKQVHGMKRTVNMLAQACTHRKFRWKMFQHYITIRARSQFSWLMTERAFRGRLRLDHKKKELKLMVQPNQQEKDSGRGPKTLSGGEKSFSTICLLLALWEAMGSSIRCLDEFDVFMDAVNRKTSVTMLIRAARRSIGKQFILITPQDMTGIDSSPDVKVIRLNPPERNQGTLNVQRG